MPLLHQQCAVAGDTLPLLHVAVAAHRPTPGNRTAPIIIFIMLLKTAPALACCMPVSLCWPAEFLLYDPAAQASRRRQACLRRRPAARGGPLGINRSPCQRRAGQPPGVAP